MSVMILHSETLQWSLMFAGPTQSHKKTCNTYVGPQLGTQYFYKNASHIVESLRFCSPFISNGWRLCHVIFNFPPQKNRKDGGPQFYSRCKMPILRLVWPLKCVLMSFARNTSCYFRLYVQWMYMIFSLLVITKITSGNCVH